MYDLFDDESDNDMDQWTQSKGQWICQKNGRTLVVERVGLFLRRWRFWVVQESGTADSQVEAMTKAEALVAPKNTTLRLLQG